MTPKHFCEYAQENSHGIKHFSVSQVGIRETKTELKEYFSNCMEIPNIKENHYYIQTKFQHNDSFLSLWFDTRVFRQNSGPTHTAHNDITLYNCLVES
jgi:hypothetical protein